MYFLVLIAFTCLIGTHTHTHAHIGSSPANCSYSLTSFNTQITPYCWGSPTAYGGPPVSGVCICIFVRDSCRHERRLKKQAGGERKWKDSDLRKLSLDFQSSESFGSPFSSCLAFGTRDFELSHPSSNRCYVLCLMSHEQRVMPLLCRQSCSQRRSIRACHHPSDRGPMRRRVRQRIQQRQLLVQSCRGSRDPGVCVCVCVSCAIDLECVSPFSGCSEMRSP